MTRTIVVWCPDWPAVAAARQAGRSAADPVAVFHANRVRACSAAARGEGVRVGQRRRDAQARCPELLVAAVDQDRDARMFEPVAAAVEEHAPGVEVLRSGVVACPARGPSRYFGSEAAAAERIVDAVEALDVECCVGIADDLEVAVLAAHRTAIVPTGGSAAFCAGLPIIDLSRDPAICPPTRVELTDLLIRLGITTVGAFAALPPDKVATRFGADGVRAHRLALGRPERGLSRRQIPEELVVEQECDPPLDRVDAAAFAARALAERFHARLADAGLACTRLVITAATDRGATLSRTWRCAAPLTAAATADRLRWQLDGWLTHRREPGAITRLVLEPVEAVGSGHIQYGLWGSDGQDDQRAGWAFARVQGLLGPESVLSPVPAGGRSAQDRVTLVPWGDERVSPRDPAAPWPGAIPAPSPARLADPTPITVLDEAGGPVRLTDRGLLTGPPARLDGKRVDAWAGPWLLDERWWAGGEVAARLQLVTDDGAALLVRSTGGGDGGWRIEGVYD
ncbi:DNA polymerase Y family protein [Nakamurella sp.]|uniref:DNA polymerase Y family protein n=1 Tax=Nakamurella sp. TaxID=1869182 RepID=UPI0037846D5E